jgi:hypothetical protein
MPSRLAFRELRRSDGCLARYGTATVTCSLGGHTPASFYARSRTKYVPLGALAAKLTPGQSGVDV